GVAWQPLDLFGHDAVDAPMPTIELHADRAKFDLAVVGFQNDTVTIVRLRVVHFSEVEIHLAATRVAAVQHGGEYDTVSHSCVECPALQRSVRRVQKGVDVPNLAIDHLSRLRREGRLLTMDDFRHEIRRLIERAELRGASAIELNAGKIHRHLGDYPGSDHRMPLCCAAMFSEQDEATDQIIA